jgi:hypothetical protein
LEFRFKIGCIIGRTPKAGSRLSPTITLECPIENPESYGRHTFSLSQQFSGRTVDCGDVVGIESVPHSQQVGSQAHSLAECIVASTWVLVRSFSAVLSVAMMRRSYF